MGIVTGGNAQNLPITNVSYSATIGGMYVRNPENEAALNAVKAEVGEAEWKKGFQGPNSKAVQQARKVGLGNIKLTGKLTSVKPREVEADGRKTTYVQVGMKDADGRYFLSLDIGSESAQRLVRKLFNAKPGLETEIGLWARMEDIREGQTRAYASHAASVKQDAQEVPGVSPADELKGLVQTALNVLKDAGVDDKEMLAKRRAKVTAEYHIGLVNKIAAAFATYYEARDKIGRAHV